MTWDEFVAAVGLYKEKFSGRTEEDFAYLRCRKLLDGRSVAERAARSREIVRFLNDWKCGVNKDRTPPVLAAWVRANHQRLENLADLTIAAPEVLDRLDEIQELYDDLWGVARKEIRTWGPAANAKTLHMLVPRLFVMWDKNIVPYASDYADFTAEMHRLATRMIEESPFACNSDWATPYSSPWRSTSTSSTGTRWLGPAALCAAPDASSGSASAVSRSVL
jgi:hypothetical protein